jgi:translation initiation factor IF-3
MAFKINNPAPNPASPTNSGGGSIITANSNPSPIVPRAPGSAPPSSTFSPRPRPYPSRDRNFNREEKDDVRLNERIRVPNVRLIDENGEQVGVVPTVQALQMARDRGLDLMEVAATANPPVCKICDYGKFKYEKKKKETVARKNQVIQKVKEVQLRPNTDQHDLDYKIKNSHEFLEEGDKVKFTLLFRGREIAHTEPGYKMCAEIVEKLKDVGIVEYYPKLEGKKMIMILSPNPANKKK